MVTTTAVLAPTDLMTARSQGLGPIFDKPKHPRLTPPAAEGGEVEDRRPDAQGDLLDRYAKAGAQLALEESYRDALMQYVAQAAKRLGLRVTELDRPVGSVPLVPGGRSPILIESDKDYDNAEEVRDDLVDFAYQDVRVEHVLDEPILGWRVTTR